MVDVPGTLLAAAALVTAAGTFVKQVRTHSDVKRNKESTQRIEHEVRDQNVRTAELEGQMAQAFKLLVEGQAAGQAVGKAMLDYFQGRDKEP